jgi:pyruvate/2-oxoglutarate dehydrogenase complex dihydrolipoamide dehydrogenase (E3) component
MAAIVQQTLEEEGITFQMNAVVVNTCDLGREREVLLQLSDGKTVVIFRAEAILVALGCTPNVSGLGLEKIDIHFDQNFWKDIASYSTYPSVMI